jgi:hypothetical protein
MHINIKKKDNRIQVTARAVTGGTISDEIGPLQKFGFFFLKLSRKVFESDY